LLGSLNRRAAFRVVVGPYCCGTTPLLEACASMPGVTVLKAPSSLADEMAACDLAIVSGGTLAYEACALGRPAIVISQNEDQACEAAVLATEGAILDAGRHDRISDAEVVRVIRQIWDNPAKRLAQAKRAGLFVPRDGALRVATAILDQLKFAATKANVVSGARPR